MTNKDIKGMCLALGFIGLAYVAFLILVAAVTGAKIYKSIVIITLLCSAMITFGLNQQVRDRISMYAKSFFVK